MGISNKYKIILAHDTTDVKLLSVYFVPFRFNSLFFQNIFCIIKIVVYVQSFRSRTQAHSWQKPFNLPGCSASSAHCITRPVPGKLIESIRHQFTMISTGWLSYQNLCGIYVEAPFVTHNVADRKHSCLFTSWQICPKWHHSNFCLLISRCLPNVKQIESRVFW